MSTKAFIEKYPENYLAIPPAPISRTFRYRVIKRIIDIVCSAIFLIVFSPFFVLIAIFVGTSSKGAILYKWRVVGHGGKWFTGYKFRTMVQDADKLKNLLLAGNEMTGPVFKLTNDPRITSVGRFLRKYSLDELPQMWSVLKGEMSLVGPRPPLQSEWLQFQPWHREKLSVKPGITCIWQVSGRNQISDFDDWVKLDLDYIKTWSLTSDLRIVLKTFRSIFIGTGQ